MKPTKLYWLWLSPLYWYVAYQLLYHVSPISFDGSGPTASLYWSNDIPAPTLREYDTNRALRLQFLIPYFVAATVLTLQSCGMAAFLLGERQPKVRRVPLASAGISFLMMMASAASSDAGSRMGFWHAPLMFVDVLSVLTVLEVIMPLSCLAAIFALVPPGIFDRRYPRDMLYAVVLSTGHKRGER